MDKYAQKNVLSELQDQLEMVTSRCGTLVQQLDIVRSLTQTTLNKGEDEKVVNENPIGNDNDEYTVEAESTILVEDSRIYDFDISYSKEEMLPLEHGFPKKTLIQMVANPPQKTLAVDLSNIESDPIFKTDIQSTLSSSVCDLPVENNNEMNEKKIVEVIQSSVSSSDEFSDSSGFKEKITNKEKQKNVKTSHHLMKNIYTNIHKVSKHAADIEMETKLNMLININSELGGLNSTLKENADKVNMDGEITYENMPTLGEERKSNTESNSDKSPSNFLKNYENNKLNTNNTLANESKTKVNMNREQTLEDILNSFEQRKRSLDSSKVDEKHSNFMNHIKKKKLSANEDNSKVCMDRAKSHEDIPILFEEERKRNARSNKVDHKLSNFISHDKKTNPNNSNNKDKNKLNVIRKKTNSDVPILFGGERKRNTGSSNDDDKRSNLINHNKKKNLSNSTNEDKIKEIVMEKKGDTNSSKRYSLTELNKSLKESILNLHKKHSEQQNNINANLNPKYDILRSSENKKKSSKRMNISKKSIQHFLDVKNNDTKFIKRIFNNVDQSENIIVDTNNKSKSINEVLKENNNSTTSVKDKNKSLKKKNKHGKKEMNRNKLKRIDEVFNSAPQNTHHSSIDNKLKESNSISYNGFYSKLSNNITKKDLNEPQYTHLITKLETNDTSEGKKTPRMMLRNLMTELNQEVETKTNRQSKRDSILNKTNCESSKCSQKNKNTNKLKNEMVLPSNMDFYNTENTQKLADDGIQKNKFHGSKENLNFRDKMIKNKDTENVVKNGEIKKFKSLVGRNKDQLSTKKWDNHSITSGNTMKSFKNDGKQLKYEGNDNKSNVTELEKCNRKFNPSTAPVSNFKIKDYTKNKMEKSESDFALFKLLPANHLKYTLSTISTRDLNKDKYCKVSFNSIPFVVGQSISQSHHIGLNIQQTLSMLKRNHAPPSAIENVLDNALVPDNQSVVSTCSRNGACKKTICPMIVEEMKSNKTETAESKDLEVLEQDSWQLRNDVQSKCLCIPRKGLSYNDVIGQFMQKELFGVPAPPRSVVEEQGCDQDLYNESIISQKIHANSKGNLIRLLRQIKNIQRNIQFTLCIK